MATLKTTRQAAEALGVSADTIIRWWKDGRIQPAIRAGRTVRWDLAELRRALAPAPDQENTPATPTSQEINL